MIYKDFKELKLSQLGFGAMRLPLIGNDEADINVKSTTEMVAYAMEHGINYYDTAWGYHAGNSEIVMGKILSKYPRESYYLATKFPGYDLDNMGKVETIFERQLEKCGVEYFDFYLVHNVCELNIDAYLDEEYGILEYLLKQKEIGRIRYLGFSVHGSYEVTKRFLEAYGEHMEFCQIQLNYLDWEFQNAKAKVELLNAYQIPIWVMEPLRGGKLVTLEPVEEKRLKNQRLEESIPAWAFRFLQSIQGVNVILSGMSNLEQLQQNMKTFEEEKPLNSKEMNTVLEIAESMTEKRTLPCTACRYCLSHCPKELDIPNLIELYNEHRFTGGGFIAPMALRIIPEAKQPMSCVGCRNCEMVCPQNIKISEAMTDFAARLNL